MTTYTQEELSARVDAAFELAACVCEDRAQDAWPSTRDLLGEMARRIRELKAVEW